MSGIGEDVLEQLEYKPGRLFVRRLVRKKYACRKCGNGVVTGAPHAQVIDKGLAGPWLISHIVTSKYADHLPLHRLEGMLWREGVHVTRSTMVGWIARAAELLEPVVLRMKQLLLASGYVRTDETPIKVLDEGKTRTAYVRVWACDRSRRWRVFEYAVDRTGALVRDFLGDWTGDLQCDAYSGYDGVFASGRVLELACWAHTRRYFFEAKDSDREIALGALARISLLYDVERACDEADKADPPGTPLCLKLARRLKARRERARPVLDEFAAWLRALQSSVLPKSPMGAAVTYALNQWEALNRYVERPHAAIDNNLAERELRAVAVGRKNWEFAGSDLGGERAAILYSITATCKANGVDPEAYIADVLMRLATTPDSKIDEILPDRWRATSTASPAMAKP
jgi:transposase